MIYRQLSSLEYDLQRFFEFKNAEHFFGKDCAIGVSRAFTFEIYKGAFAIHIRLFHEGDIEVVLTSGEGQERVRIPGTLDPMDYDEQATGVLKAILDYDDRLTTVEKS
jgi:hypothetical protein